MPSVFVITLPYSFRRFWRWTFVSWLAFHQAIASEAPSTLANLRESIRQKLASSRQSIALRGMQFVSLDSGVTLYETNADRFFIPASNTKLFTAAFALDHFGSESRFRTELFITRAPDSSGVVSGDLILKGHGDPSVAAGGHRADWESLILPLVTALDSKHIRRIQGDLVCDESELRNPHFGRGWTWDDIASGIVAPVSALTFRDNLIDIVLTPGMTTNDPVAVRIIPFDDFRSAKAREIAVKIQNQAVTVAATQPKRIKVETEPGSLLVTISGQLPSNSGETFEFVPASSPAAYFGACLLDAMERRGITVDGGIRVLSFHQNTKAGGPHEWTKISELTSPPLKTLVSEMLKPSQNLHAELLLLDTGADLDRSVTGGRGNGEESAIQALGTFLDHCGIQPGEVLLEEGSGLSRKNLVTPRAVVQLLKYMAGHREAVAWRDALPIGGIDGTLRNRFTRPPTRGVVRAKTGSLTYVQSLSGYLTTLRREKIAFSILFNNYTGPNSATNAKAEIDGLVELVTSFSGVTQ
jgi:D-alanyl-D-alanine carboxypeptidase/D-alanyl-D-alanine-endopeptidase (penicillin-binding protein 4)